MSLLPRCPICGGLEVGNGPMGRSMNSRCKCGEQLTQTHSDPFGKAMIAHDLADAMEKLVMRATNLREREADQQSPEQSK